MKGGAMTIFINHVLAALPAYIEVFVKYLLETLDRVAVVLTIVGYVQQHGIDSRQGRGRLRRRH